MSVYIFFDIYARIIIVGTYIVKYFHNLNNSRKNVSIFSGTVLSIFDV